MNISTLVIDHAVFRRMPIVKTSDQQKGQAAQGIASRRLCSTGQWLCMDYLQMEFLPTVPGVVTDGFVLKLEQTVTAEVSK